MYDYRVVPECDESTRIMKLPLELYGTDEHAALGAWVLLEANIAPLQDAPVAHPTPCAMSKVGKSIIPQCSPYKSRHPRWLGRLSSSQKKTIW